MESDLKISVAIVEDEIIHYKILKLILSEEKFEVDWYQKGAEFLNNIHKNYDIITLDHMLPDMLGVDILKKIKEWNSQSDNNIIYFSGQDDVSVVVDVYDLGVKNYIIKNQNASVVFRNAIKNIEQNILLKKELEQLRKLVLNRTKYKDLIGESDEIRKVLNLIQKVEKSDMLTLITGESGTGKELVARAIHFNSGRSKRPFIPVNVSAIPFDLVESELFGHEKGAFTGAENKRIGKFEEANGGTIFLDEIGDMDLNIQTKILRVLQEKKITRLGSNKEIPLDIRILLATNRNIAKMVKEGTFREDLFYRVQGFLIHIPPLRERNNDIIILTEFFISDFCKKNKIPVKTIAKDSYLKMLNHKWPGNVRELKSVIERAILISNSNEIIAEDIIFSDF